MQDEMYDKPEGAGWSCILCEGVVVLLELRINHASRFLWVPHFCLQRTWCCLCKEPTLPVIHILSRHDTPVQKIPSSITEFGHGSVIMTLVFTGSTSFYGFTCPSQSSRCRWLKPRNQELRWPENSRVGGQPFQNLVESFSAKKVGS